MENTNHFRVKSRDMSPDVIERNLGTIEKPIWKVYIAPISNRNDMIAHAICNDLNENNKY